jgi:hypothetical protein
MRRGARRWLPGATGWSADLHRPKLAGGGGAAAGCPPMAGGGRVRRRVRPAWADVPADLRQAVLLLAAEFYEHRHDDGAAAGLPGGGGDGLIERWRQVRIWAGGGDERAASEPRAGAGGAADAPRRGRRLCRDLGKRWARSGPRSAGGGRDPAGEEVMLSSVPIGSRCGRRRWGRGAPEAGAAVPRGGAAFRHPGGDRARSATGAI